ncbi:MAG: hypothetical protein ACREKN_04035 [Longimicrobiaceae bacterium]
MLRTITLTASAALLLGGCIPYPVGSTAETAPPRRPSTSVTAYAIPNGVRPPGADSSAAVSYMSADTEVRFGLSDVSDIGVRVPSGSGFILNYKYRFAGGWNPPRLMWAVMPGAGVVNFGQHAHAELSLLASMPSESGSLTPYGGLRAMQVFPLSTSAVTDSPTLGGFAGLRIGSTDLGVSPELAVYYDRSALDIRDNNVIFVPSLSVHGFDLLGYLFGGGGRWPFFSAP